MRPTRSINARKSRNSGVNSGTTFQTGGAGASGVTIDKTAVRVGSGTSITTDGIHTGAGYPHYNPTTNNLVMISGTTQTGGTSRYMSATGLGLNTLTTFLCQICGGTSGANFRAGTTGFVNCAFDHTNNTGVTVFMFDSTGASITTGVSLQYVAFGT